MLLYIEDGENSLNNATAQSHRFYRDSRNKSNIAFSSTLFLNKILIQE